MGSVICHLANNLDCLVGTLDCLVEILGCLAVSLDWVGILGYWVETLDCLVEFLELVGCNLESFDSEVHKDYCKWEGFGVDQHYSKLEVEVEELFDWLGVASQRCQDKDYESPLNQVYKLLDY